MLTKATKSSFLDFFYEHVSEDDWLEGVDLYQAGKVEGLQSFNGLVTGKVASLHQKLEVRIKIHPNGHQIQWMECTCRKNRTRGAYCEHMAALMLHIDREHPKLLGQLSSSMPMKPPVSARKTKKVPEEPKPEGANAQDTILSHLNSSIHSVSLLAKGPTIRVRLEIKEGQLTHYDLKVDAAAKFLQEKRRIKNSTPEVKELKVFKTQALLGTRIYQKSDEELIAERVVAIKHTPKSAEAAQKSGLRHDFAKMRMIFPDGRKSKEALYEFVTLKTALKFVGTEYFFLPGRGYWPLEKAKVSEEWFELPLQRTHKEDSAAEVVRTSFKAYLDVGPIWLSEDLKDPQVVEAPKLGEIRIKSEKDGWFTLDPRYGEGKGSVSMAELMQVYRKKRRTFHKANGAWYKIPELVKQYEWDLDASGKYLKVDTLGLMRLRAALGELDQFAGSKKLINQLRNRIEFNPVGSVPSLEASNLNLRKYQENGLEWLWWLYENRLHGLLADEMGLGKTHQAMALLTGVLAKKKDAKFLAICPTTVLDHWYDKVEEFCPNLKPLKHHGPKRSFTSDQVGRRHHLIITSYGVLLRDIRQLSEIEWDVVVLDEAHFVKNNATATYSSVCRLKGDIRICLTGTPMENNISELKNIFDFLVPGYLGSDDYFRRNFIRPMDSDNDQGAELQLQKLIHPFKLRRTKENVLDDLPAKIEDIRHCALSNEQVKLYRDVVELKASPLVKQLENDQSPIPYLHVFATLTLLKQICDHPALVTDSKDYKRHESGKFELLKDLLEEAIASDHKVVIYSQYVQMIEIIKNYLTDQDIGHVILTGQTRNRGKVIKQFQEDPSKKIFVGSLLAGGIGVDLTAASVVIHYDRWWNASKENQATDRVHRIGQNKNVQVLKLVCRGTLEEKIDAMIRTKQRLFEKFLDKDEELFKSLSRQELIELLR